MTTYKSYAECKIANPDSEIYCAMISNDGRGIYGKLIDINMVTKSHYLCNPADYCSSVKEFLEAGFKLDEGDRFIGIDGVVVSVSNSNSSNIPNYSNANRYILSAAALNGGCKIPAKARQWTIYNNDMPLRELTDEQVGKLVKHSGCVEHMNPNSGDWAATITPMWNRAGVYRIKPKSERELFIETSVQLMTSETERTMEQMFGAQFDAGARYTENTQHFGESV